MSRYLPWGPNSEADTQAFLESVIKYQLNNSRYDYEIAVVTKVDKKLIGACGIHIENQVNKEGWIGYCYNKQFWRNGYASEAAMAIIKIGFSQLKLHRIFATCDPLNTSSARVLEKVGMLKEGHLRENKWQKGKYRDSFIYAILDYEQKCTI